MIPADLHNHTHISHGEASAAQMYAAACRAPLEYYGFSEHSPLPPGFSCPLYLGDLAADFPSYVREVLALKETGSGPQVLLGAELDWIPSNPGWMRDFAAAYPFDYLIGGLHFLERLAVGSPKNWDCPEEEKFRRYAAYYREMARMAASGLVDVVAHPDFIKVRSYASFQAWLGLPESRALIRETLTVMKKAGVALEISSAGLRKEFEEPYPAPAIMALAAETGVPIAFGSDAHNTTDTVSGFDRLAEYARSFGFTQSLIFEKRQKRALPF